MPAHQFSLLMILLTFLAVTLVGSGMFLCLRSERGAEAPTHAPE